jgi:hypothetical protein
VILSYILENTARLSLSESWDRTCSVMNDRPLSAAYWKMDELSGEKFLDELPELQLSEEKIFDEIN